MWRGAHRCGWPGVVLVVLLLPGPWSRAGEGVESTGLLRGHVRDAAGQPLAGLRVRLLERGQAPGGSAALAEAATGRDGAFGLPAPEGADLLLKVEGDRGRGRVAVEAGALNEPLEVTYPVRTKILLLHDNDLHFNFNRPDRFEAMVESFRQRYENVFLLSAGDIFIRHPMRWPEPDPGYYAQRSRFMIEAMNRAGYDALTLGNHELDYIGGLTRASLELAEFPLLAANVEVATENLPQPEPYVLFETRNRRTLAVLGLTVVNFEKEGVGDLDPVETARAYLHLAEEHDLFVALTHIGVRADRLLAEEVEQLDVILGGHSHTLLEEAERVNAVLVAQAGGVPGGHPVSKQLPRHLGKVVVVLENGRVVEKRGRVLEVD